MSELPADPELVELATVGLEYGIHLVAGHAGETFQPALFTRDPAGRHNITQLVALALKIDDVFDFACQRLRELPTPGAAGVVMDGNVTLDGEHYDAVIVRVGKPAADQSHEFRPALGARRLHGQAAGAGWEPWLRRLQARTIRLGKLAIEVRRHPGSPE